MIRDDTGHLLLPLLTEALHPGILRLIALRQSGEAHVGGPKVIELEQYAKEAVLQLAGTRADRPSLPGWHVLRALGGEIAEVAAFAAGEEATVDAPLLTAGRFEKGGLFRGAFLPHQRQDSWRLVLIGDDGQADLYFPLSSSGPAFLSWVDQEGHAREETWDPWDPWPAVVSLVESAIAQPAKAMAITKEPTAGVVTWQDAVRGLELDDAARRAIERRRVSSMEYQEANEEVGFKGTMTLVGCALVWVILLLFILSAWLPDLRWAIVPVLVAFLSLQLFRWIIPRRRPENEAAKSNQNNPKAQT
jgi:hypothetical protein